MSYLWKLQSVASVKKAFLPQYAAIYCAAATLRCQWCNAGHKIGWSLSLRDWRESFELWWFFFRRPEQSSNFGPEGSKLQKTGSFPILRKTRFFVSSGAENRFVWHSFDQLNQWTKTNSWRRGWTRNPILQKHISTASLETSEMNHLVGLIVS